MDMTLTVHTGLDRFLMIDRIKEVSTSHILAEKKILKTEDRIFTGIETLAQTGALHVRYLLDFSKHAFLLSIKSYGGPVQLPSGLYTVSGLCKNRSRDAFEYILTAENIDGSTFKGQFLFAVSDYGREFKQTHLEDHYRNIFSCLTKDIEKNSITSG
jgi:hypothetical protein